MSSEEVVDWPPVYTLKKSKRARHVLLRITPQRGLELTIPYRYKPNDLPDVLANKRDWIEKNLALVKQQLQNQAAHQLPIAINLHAIAQTYRIHYIPATKTHLLERPNQELVIMGDIEDKLTCKKLLLSWLKAQAKQQLIPWLTRLSEEIVLPFSSVTIRDQTTRWGSCTLKKAISLNCKLLFLPKHLVRYIMIHELCHTVHLNHSLRFWRLVERFEPAWRQYRREVRQTQLFVPFWVE